METISLDTAIIRYVLKDTEDVNVDVQDFNLKVTDEKDEPE